MVSVTLRSLCVEDRPGANDGSDRVDNEVRHWQFHGQVCCRVFGCFSSIDWFGFRDLLGTARVRLTPGVCSAGISPNLRAIISERGWWPKFFAVSFFCSDEGMPL